MEVSVGVSVRVLVGVLVAVSVGVNVRVAVLVSVWVSVLVAVAVDVADGGIVVSVGSDCADWQEANPADKQAARRIRAIVRDKFIMGESLLGMMFIDGPY